MKSFQPNSSKEIVDKLESVEGKSSPSFDGHILAAIMEMIINHGFKLEDFGELIIKDVIDSKGQVKWPFETSQPMPMEEFTELIQSHIGYLKDKAYNISKKAPLFPQLKIKDKKQESPGYHHRELRRDLKEHADTTWEDLRRDGIHYQYEELKKKGLSDEEIVSNIAALFREGKNKIIETLKKGGVKLTGVKKKPLSKFHQQNRNP